METDPLLHSRVPELANEHDDGQVSGTYVKADFNAKLVGSLLVDSIPGEYWCYQSKSFVSESLSVILSYILQNSIQTIAVLIVGRLGPEELSAAAFSYMLAFVTGE